MNEPLVLLAGMMCDARLYRAQIEAFSSERTVSVPALIGYDSVNALAKKVLEESPPYFSLAGLSMGGIVAMEIMRLAPDRVSRLALLDTNPLAETETQAARRAPQIERALNGELRTIMRDEMKPNYLTDGPNTGRILDLCMAMAETLGPSVFADQSHALQTRRDQSDTLRALSVPALILCGEDDGLCPLHRHTLMHELIPDSHLEVIANAGHLPVLEQPAATNAALRRWLG